VSDHELVGPGLQCLDDPAVPLQGDREAWSDRAFQGRSRRPLAEGARGDRGADADERDKDKRLPQHFALLWRGPCCYASILELDSSSSDSAELGQPGEPMLRAAAKLPAVTRPGGQLIKGEA